MSYECVCPFPAISQSPSLKGKRNATKTMICAFLARVMHGKQLGKLLQSEAELSLPVVHPSTSACYLRAAILLYSEWKLVPQGGQRQPYDLQHTE